MWKAILAGTTALAIAGTTAVYAQQRNGPPERHHWQFSQQDRDAFFAARIAALKAGLELNADQEKNWPAFESALKGLYQYRAEQHEARAKAQPSTDPTERLRHRADALAGYSAALKKLADAQAPLYNSLNDAQKRRFAVLAHLRHRAAWHHEHHRFGPAMGGDGHRWHHGLEGHDGDRAGAGHEQAL